VHHLYWSLCSKRSTARSGRWLPRPHQKQVISDQISTFMTPTSYSYALFVTP
jgi:hypothetical protein